MSEPKKHHYVPQFYLKNFSEDRKNINLYNFKRDHFIGGAPISGQCYRRKLHSFQPGLEQRLGKMEQEASAAIRAILDIREAPPIQAKEWMDMLIFTIFQKSRTARSIESAETMKDFYIDHLTSGNAPEPGSAVEKIVADKTTSAQIVFSIIPEIAGVVTDLKMHLLINDTPEDFLIGDDPVVLHNMYCEGTTHRGVLGWDCRGLQAFVPLSPKILLMLYDLETYRVNGDRGAQHTTTLQSTRDIRSLNSLQALNAHENLYFYGAPTPDLETFCHQMREKRVKGRSTLVITKPTKEADGTTSQLLHTFEPLLPIRLAPSFIKIRQSAKSVPLHQRSALYRHPLPKQIHPNVGRHTRYEVSDMQHR